MEDLDKVDTWYSRQMNSTTTTCTAEGIEYLEYVLERTERLNSELKKYAIKIRFRKDEASNNLRITLGEVCRGVEGLTRTLHMVINLCRHNQSPERRGVSREGLSSSVLQRSVNSDSRNVEVRAKVRWHVEGERNSKMFHKVANGNRRRNAIFKLNINSEEVVCQDRIKSEVIEFCEKLYSRVGEEIVVLEDCCFSTISEMENSVLGRDIAEDEVLSTIYKLFQIGAAWDVIKIDFMKVVEEFNATGGFNWRLNCTFLSLIPKKNNVVELKDFRPISLVSTIYKVLAKVLANRLKVVMPKLVSQLQGAFLAGRQILDGILIANELIDSRKKEGKAGIVYKLDMEKAYDHVLWDSVEVVLRKMGFGWKWRRWVRWCISTARFSVILNGAAKGFFKASRGLRQGDPLSPFLFLLVAEVFNKLMHNAEMEGCLKGFYVNENGMEISHLQFADDTIVFLDARVQEGQKLLKVLEKFKTKTGLKVNLSKSSMMGIEFHQDCIQDCAVLADCAVGEFPFSYLGIPVGASTRAKSVWNIVIEKMTLRLAPWKRRYLSRAGRNEGGLGLRNLKSTNVALLTKWLWRYGEEKSSLWRKIILEKFGGVEEAWVPKDSKNTYGWGLWRDKTLKELFPKLWKVNGKKEALVEEGRSIPIKFPSDYIWNKNIPPKISFLVWAAAIRVVPTLSVLARRGIEIWEHFLQQLNIVWVHPTTVLEFLWRWKLNAAIMPMVFLRYCVPFAIWWIVWLERNNILIAKKQDSVNTDIFVASINGASGRDGDKTKK
ncbi:uncharacterized protein LOC113337116 [Papaver somniferum]|uniref:uncharacterized protein LOC113337116 n=1 Tax=Papaver somniferum TaxID=3469 RepID=UPI000E6FF677|nr:uncharacterized protein LOC113337116 [Papaver somniferum]